MAYAAVLWIVGLGCLIVAAAGKEVTFSNVQLPATKEKKARWAMGGIGVLALVLGLALFVRPDGAQGTQQAAAPASGATISPSGTGSQPGTAQAVSEQANSASPTPASSVAAASASYLADLTPTGGSTPKTGPWSINDQQYAHSIGYAGECLGQTVNYAIHGSFHFFNATVGVDDNADQLDQGPPSSASPIEFIVYANPGGGAVKKIADVTGSWRNPATIHANISDATLLTLDTDAVGITCLAPDSIAFWGNAELVP